MWRGGVEALKVGAMGRTAREVCEAPAFRLHESLHRNEGSRHGKVNEVEKGCEELVKTQWEEYMLAYLQKTTSGTGHDP